MALRLKTMSHLQNQHLCLFLIQIKWNYSIQTLMSLKPQLLQFLPHLYFIVGLNHHNKSYHCLINDCFDVLIIPHSYLLSHYFSHLSIHSHYIFDFFIHKILLKSCSNRFGYSLYVFFLDQGPWRANPIILYSFLILKYVYNYYILI